MKINLRVSMAAVLILISLLAACGDASSTTTPAISTTAPSVTTAATTSPIITTDPATTSTAVTTVASSNTTTTGNAATTSDADLTFTDKTGTKVTLPRKAERIVALSSNAVEWLWLLGIDPVAINQFHGSNYAASSFMFGDRAKSFPSVSGSENQPNLEDIVKFKPDLVVGSLQQSEARKGLPPVPFFLSQPVTLDDALADFRTLARLAGRSEKAEDVIKQFNDHLAAYKAKSPANKKILIIGSADGKTLFAQSEKTALCSTLNQLSPCQWQLPDLSNGLAAFGLFQPSLEELLKLDPDVIFAWGLPGAPNWTESVKDNPVWKNLKAVKNNTIYFSSEGEIWNSTTPLGLSKLIDEIMTKTYPAVFS